MITVVRPMSCHVPLVRSSVQLEASNVAGLLPPSNTPLLTDPVRFKRAVRGHHALHGVNLAACRRQAYNVRLCQ